MATASLKNLSFTQPRRATGAPSVSNVTLEIRDREFAVLNGPMGCGTTILRLIAGLEEISGGEIVLGEKRANDLKPNEREVAIVFTEDALYRQMSIRQNIAFGLKQRKFPKAESTRRVEDAARALGIAEMLEKRPAELSSVERQRVSIARAIARQPKVLLFDEPLANFDPVTRASLRADLRKLHERLEATIIYATRDATEAMALGERVVVLREGHVEQDGSPAAVYETPANLFVAGFFGMSPMNFIHGTLKAERDALVFRETGEGTAEARFSFAEHSAAAEFAGKPVVLGVRPDDVEIVEAAKGQEPPNSFPVLIDFVEKVGAEATFHMETGAHTVIARSGAGWHERAGRRARILFDEKKMHLFDPGSTRRITGA